jgi:putative ABC transport system substrate-binding protein
MQFDRLIIRRREFIISLGGAVALPLAARAQQPEKIKRIAVLQGTPNDPESQARVAAFRQGLEELKWQEGRNLRFDIRWGAGNADRIKIYAAELVSLAPDLILATNTPTARALKQATTTIPIVFAGLSDPIGDDIVTSLARPGGNITGFTSFNAEIAGKWLQLLKEVSPGTTRATVIFNPKTAPYAIFLPVMQAVAPQNGISLTTAEVSDRSEIEAAIGKLAGAPRAGLVVMPDVFTSLHRETIFTLAIREKLPTVCPLDAFAKAGGLVSYGSNFTELFRQAASYVDRILRGEKPSDLPVQDPTRYELIINLKTAKALGLEVPPTMLARADEVIE